MGLGADWEGGNALGWVPGGAAKQGGCPGLAVGWGESPACGNRALLWCGAGGTPLAGVWAQRWVRAAPASQGWGSWGAALSAFAPSLCISITRAPVTCPNTTMLSPSKSPAAGQQSGSVTSPGGRDTRCHCRSAGRAGSTGDSCHSWHRKPGAGRLGEQLLPHIVGCRHLTWVFAGGGLAERSRSVAGQDSQGEQLPARLFGQKAVNILRGWLQPSFGVKRVWMGWSWQLRFLAQTSPVLLTRRSWAAFRAGGVLASRWLEAPAALGRRGVPGTGSAAKPWDGHAPRPSVLKPPQPRGAPGSSV